MAPEVMNDLKMNNKNNRELFSYSINVLRKSHQFFNFIQVMKGEPVSLSSDVFSYGMLLYEIFARKLPFSDAKLDAEVFSKIMNGKVRDFKCIMTYTVNVIGQSCCTHRLSPYYHTLLHYVHKLLSLSTITAIHQLPFIPGSIEPHLAALMRLCWSANPKVGHMTYS